MISKSSVTGKNINPKILSTITFIFILLTIVKVKLQKKFGFTLNVEKKAFL